MRFVARNFEGLHGRLRRPGRLALAILLPALLSGCLLDADGDDPRTRFDFTALDTLKNPLARWYHVPGGKSLTAVKFAFRSLDYAQQADSNIAAFSAAVGVTPTAAGAYVDLRVNPVRLRALLDAVHARDVVPYVTFDPKEFANPDVAAQYGYLAQIVQGAWDAKLREVASVLRDFGHPVLLRWAHEMNGNWYPYSGTFAGGGRDADGNGVADGPQAYVAAWRHVHTLFAAEGADKIAWVYSPNAESFPDAAWNGPYAYYPGSEYVDLIAVDVYEHPEKRRRGLGDLLAPVYNDLGLFWERTAGDTAYALRPFGLGEYGTARTGLADRLAWYADAFTTLQDDARVAFHAVYNAQNGPKDFSLGGGGSGLHGVYSGARFAFAPLEVETESGVTLARLGR